MVLIHASLYLGHLPLLDYVGYYHIIMRPLIVFAHFQYHYVGQMLKMNNGGLNFKLESSLDVTWLVDEQYMLMT